MLSYLLKAHITELLMQKVTAVRELYQAGKAMSNPNSSNRAELHRLLEVAQQRATEYVNANNAFCEQFPKEGKKFLSVDAVIAELIAGLQNCLKCAVPAKRQREESAAPQRAEGVPRCSNSFK
jgi:hypothetical protein